MPVLEKRVSRLEEVFERFLYEMFLWREKTDKTIARLEENIKEIQLDRKKAEERWEKESKERDKRWEREKKERDEKWEKEKKERDEKWEREKKERDEKWEKEKAEMNKRWGEIANKMGTIVEDIVAPNIPTIAKKYFGIQKPLFFATRIEKMNPTTHQIREFDIILVGPNSVILNETKATVRAEYVNRFIHFIEKGSFFDYFPEYKDKKLIPIFSSLSIKPQVVQKLTQHNIYAMALKGDSMDILNPELKISD